MPQVPFYLSVVFAATTLVTGALFWSASKRSKFVLYGSIVWLAIHGVLAYSGFYQELEVQPPRITLALFPTLMGIVLLFAFKKTRTCLAKLDMKGLTLLHTIRVPVEIVLYLLFTFGAIPELMTFSGRNWDILAGLTAPVVYYYGFVCKTLSNKTILLWNLLCLGLLLNIVGNALLSAPLPFQQFAFEQPNKALFFFPFTWLPAYVVPVVLLAHLVVIYRLLRTP